MNIFSFSKQQIVLGLSVLVVITAVFTITYASESGSEDNKTFLPRIMKESDGSPIDPPANTTATPTATATATTTPTATPTQQPTDTATPTYTPTPGQPFITLLPNCGGGGRSHVSFHVLGFNWPTDDDVTLFWDNIQLQYTVPSDQHNGAFSVPMAIPIVQDGIYLVRAISDSADVTAEYTVPCYYATPTATPTEPPEICPVEFVMPPYSGFRWVAITGEVGAQIEVYDISENPPLLIGSATLQEEDGFACSGYFDFKTGGINPAFVANHLIEVIQYVDGVQHSTDAEFVVPPPTPTSTPTNTPVPIDLLLVDPPQIVSSHPLTAYTAVDFSVVITNSGSVDINEQFFVDVFIDPSNVYDSHIPLYQSSGYTAVSSLGGGESKTLTITAQLGFANSPNPHTVYSVVDSSNDGQGKVEESSETNNISLPLSVSTVIEASTPTVTPTPDFSGDNTIAGTINSRVVLWATQERALVTLIDSDGNIAAKTQSDENGYYQFLNVPDDTYTVYSCIAIDGISYFGIRTGVVVPNTVASVYMLPGACNISSSTNAPPIVEHPGDQYNGETDAISLQIVATDPEDDSLTYSATGLPSELSLNTSTGEIFGTLPVGSEGEYTVGLVVDDGTNQTSLVFTWHVLANELRFESLRVLDVDSEEWTTVTLQNTYLSMVATCSIRYANNGIPQVVRMQSATSGNSFDIRLQNPSNETLVGEIVDCMVIEEGVWALPNGRLIEGQKYISTVTDHDGSWGGEAQAYGSTYTNPVIFGQVMTNNDPNWSVFWSHGNPYGDPPNSTTIYTGKHVAEDPNTTRLSETIGFIVIESGDGTVDGQEYKASLGIDSVRDTLTNYSFSTSFSSGTPSIAIVTQAGMNGYQGSWAYTYGAIPFTSSKLNLIVDEDQILDLERTHTAEQVGYIVFENEVVLP